MNFTHQIKKNDRAIHVARMGKGDCRDLLRKPEGRKNHGRPRLGWEDDIKLGI
jgi:hypothetical protein